MYFIVYKVPKRLLILIAIRRVMIPMTIKDVLLIKNVLSTWQWCTNQLPSLRVTFKNRRQCLLSQGTTRPHCLPLPLRSQLQSQKMPRFTRLSLGSRRTAPTKKTLAATKITILSKSILQTKYNSSSKELLYIFKT